MNYLKKEIIKELKLKLEKILTNKILFAILYGGFCYNKNLKDLDLLVVSKKKLKKEDLESVKNLIISLSDKYCLALDEEVKYEKKLLISEKRLKEIFKLGAFRKKEGFYIPEIKNNKYLNSKKFLDRLFLNALTSPNVFLIGSKKSYERYTNSSFKSLKRLAKNLCGKKDIRNIINILIPPKKVYFKDYLGYCNLKKVRDKLKKGFNNIKK